MNIEALREAVFWVREQDGLSEDERTWDQAMWMRVASKSDENNRVGLGDDGCGTAMCIAGKIVWDAGYREYRTAFRGSEDVYFVIVVGLAQLIPRVAAEVLGVEERDAWKLFYVRNSTADDIEREAKLLARKYGYDL